MIAAIAEAFLQRGRYKAQLTHWDKIEHQMRFQQKCSSPLYLQFSEKPAICIGGMAVKISLK